MGSPSYFLLRVDKQQLLAPDTGLFASEKLRLSNDLTFWKYRFVNQPKDFVLLQRTMTKYAYLQGKTVIEKETKNPDPDVDANFRWELKLPGILGVNDEFDFKESCNNTIREDTSEEIQ